MITVFVIHFQLANSKLMRRAAQMTAYGFLRSKAIGENNSCDNFMCDLIFYQLFLALQGKKQLKK